MKWSHNGSSYYASGWNGTERWFLFSLFLNVSPLILDCNEAIIVFYNFLNFFDMCLEFSITYWVGTKRNYNLDFLSFSASSNQFLLEKKPQLYFFNFFAISYEFSITRRVGTKRSYNFYFPCFSVYSKLLWLEMKPQW